MCKAIKKLGFSSELCKSKAGSTTSMATLQRSPGESSHYSPVYLSSDTALHGVRVFIAHRFAAPSLARASKKKHRSA
jgi:hypothetical protein